MSEIQPLKKRRYFIRYGVIAILLAAIAYAIYRDATRPTTVQSTVVTTGPIQAYVEERARTTVPRIYRVTMPLDGRILPLEVREGDEVAEGEIVATLDDTDWKEASISANELKAAMESAVSAAIANVSAAKARSKFTSWVHEKLKVAADSKGVSERDLREAEWQDHDAKVKEEESIANRFSTEALYAITKLLPDITKRNLDRTKIKSPASGVILRRHVANEKTLRSGDPILDIADLNQLHITADILSEQAVRVLEKQRVEIFGEAIGPEPIAGRVRRVRPEAFTKVSSLGVEQQRVEVEISFDPVGKQRLENAGRILGLNYRLRVRIVTEEKKGVRLIPRTALFRGEQGDWQVFKIDDDDRAERVDVRIGLMNDYEAEVLTGLEPGDTVILAPEASLKDGARVETGD